jgi:hypothetical protein
MTYIIIYWIGVDYLGGNIEYHRRSLHYFMPW